MVDSELSLEDHLRNLLAIPAERTVRVQDLLDILRGKGQLLFAILLSLPFCIPFQIPGSSTPFGCLIALFGLRRMVYRHLWMPKWLLNRVIPTSWLHKLATKLLSWTQRLDRWVHPRWGWLSSSRIAIFMEGVSILLMGLVLALPIPIPLSNFPAAWAIVFLSIGSVKADGIWLLMGHVITLVTLTALVCLGYCLHGLWCT